MVKRKIIILGAGLAGLSAAWHLQKKGIPCRIFEKEPQVGGLCRSKNVNGFIFDYDGHLLHFRRRHILELIKGLLGSNLIEHRRNAWIYSYGRYIRYPFQANLHNLPLPVIKECILGFFQASMQTKSRGNKEANFLSWINRTLGKGIARHFMVPYNTKFWTVPPQKLNCEWLDGFIPVPDLNQVIKGSLGESYSQLGYNAKFWYPRKGGINQLPLAFAKEIRNIYTNTPVREINLNNKEIITSCGTVEKFDYLISTIALPELPKLIKGLPKGYISLFRKLKWNSIFNLNLGIGRKERKINTDRHWIYFPEKEISFFRVGFPHNFSSGIMPDYGNALYAEVSYSENKPIDKNRILLNIKRDLEKLGILSQEDRIYAQDMNDIEYGYPIYDRNYRGSRDRILEYLVHYNVIPCGRYGSWRYMSMEDAIIDGKKAAQVCGGV